MLVMKSANDAKTPDELKAGGFKSTNGLKSANGAKPMDDARKAHVLGKSKLGPISDTGNSRPIVQDVLTASVQVLPLPAGLYLFSVKSAAPTSSNIDGQLTLPAMHVGLGPGVRSELVEFIAGPSTHGAWLFRSGDLLVTKICGSGVTLIITSVRNPIGEVLSISVERLDNRAEIKVTAPPVNAVSAIATTRDAPGGMSPTASGESVFEADDDKLSLSVEIRAHIRTRGDMTFGNLPWAGRVGPGLWIESFSVRPTKLFGEKDIEYKGLTSSGFETPWLSEGKMCGTKGMSTPLVGFAIRLKPSPLASEYDCEYSGYFQSGKIVGPLRNSAPCRSSLASDALEGIQIRLVKRAHVLPEATGISNDPSNLPKRGAASIQSIPAKPSTRRDRPSNQRASNGRREPIRRP